LHELTQATRGAHSDVTQPTAAKWADLGVCAVTWEEGWSADATTSILIDYMYVTFPPTWPNPSSDCHGVYDHYCALVGHYRRAQKYTVRGNHMRTRKY